MEAASVLFSRRVSGMRQLRGKGESRIGAKAGLSCFTQSVYLARKTKLVFAFRYSLTSQQQSETSRGIISNIRPGGRESTEQTLVHTSSGLIWSTQDEGHMSSLHGLKSGFVFTCATVEAIKSWHAVDGSTHTSCPTSDHHSRG